MTERSTLPSAIQLILLATKNQMSQGIARCTSTPIIFLTLLTLLLLSGITRQAKADQTAPFTDAEIMDGYVVFVHPIGLRLVPDHVPARETIVDRVECMLARNERESIHIGVYPLVDTLNDIRVDVDIDLDVTVNYLLPKDSLLDKQWYQPGFFAAHETLMNDAVAPVLHRGNVQGFYLTFHAKDGTPAGLHRGKIHVRPAGRPPITLDLEVTVQPFVLPVAAAAFGMYFPTTHWLPPYSRDDRWIKACYEDMAAHSQTSVTFYYGGVDFKTDPVSGPTIQTQLPAAKAAGLIHPHIPCMLLAGNNIGELAPDEQRAGMERFREARETHGWPELLHYGRDEPAYPHPGLRDSWTPFRSVPMRLVTAISALPVYGYGDLHDVWVVYAGDITPEMKAEAKRLGAEVWSYSCHMAQGRPPKRHRYYAGLYTWAWEIGGNFEWAYHWITWWDQSDSKPRSTLSWVSRRDGVDDFRYLQLLEETLKAKPEHPLAIEAASWLTALRTKITNGPDPHLIAPNNLHDLAVDDPRGPEAIIDFDGVRARAADYLERIGAAPAPPPGVTRVSGLKDEAATFREKSIEACIAGLAGASADIRRAAATALFERGPSAANATKALVSVLDDPDVRIPAIRALEAIGPHAATVLPALAAMISHPDGFVRLSAATAVKNIAIPEEVTDASLDSPSLRAAIEILSPALADEFPPMRQMISQTLVRCGPAAAPAVPAAIKILTQPNYLYWDTALKTLAAIGPEAAPATPYLAACYEGRTAGWLQTPRMEALTLAAIGPGAIAAVPTMEKFAMDPNEQHPEYAYYALYNIRGDQSDLDQLVTMMETDEKKIGTIANFIDALGVEAKSVAPRVRLVLASQTNEDVKKTLQSFLDKVDSGVGPTPLLP